MSWLPVSVHFEPRRSFTHVSTHQTHVGKALFEHAPNCATIAAVACMSSSLLKSSLGPNLLALIWIEHKTFDLFDKIFLEYNPHMHFTQKLRMPGFDADEAPDFIEKLKSNGPHLASSLQRIEICGVFLPLFEGFMNTLRSLTLTFPHGEEALSALKPLSSLAELKLVDWGDFSANSFERLGDLEHNYNLTSLIIEVFSLKEWNSEGFKHDFCGRLLSKNRLTKLVLNAECLAQVAEDDETQAEAFANAQMTNLVELGDSIPSQWIRGDGFANLRILSVSGCSDEDLVMNIGDRCRWLEVLRIHESQANGSFFADINNLETEGAFGQLRQLEIESDNFSDDHVGKGLAELPFLERLVISASNFVGYSLNFLPNSGRPRAVSITSELFSIAHLRNFGNLVDIALSKTKLSRADILSLASFKLLESIALDDCGVAVASSELFRILCSKLKDTLQSLTCFDESESRWTRLDVEAIFAECKWLRRLWFTFDGDADVEGMNYLQKKYPRVLIEGTLMKSQVDSESGVRRERVLG